MRDANPRGEHRHRRAIPLITAALLASAACARPIPPADPQFVSEWMRHYYGIIRAERISPPVASRVLAYAAVALYEGLATASPGLVSLAGTLNGLDSLPRPHPDRRYDPILVALAAERAVLDSLFVEGLPATRAALATLTDSLETARLARGIPDVARVDSRDLGERLGAAILAWAARDGFEETRMKPFRPRVGPQFWINDSRADEYTAQNLTAVSDFVALDNPAAMLRAGEASERALAVTRPKAAEIRTLKAVNPTGATEPWWGTLRPFALRSADECPTPPPAPWSTSPGSAFYAEAKRVYDVGRALTEEQRQTVLYWADNPGQTGTPAGHWLAIGSQLVAQLGLSAEQAAEMFVLVTLAQADAFTATWHEKYRLSLLRPVTYIRRHIEPSWTPAIVTPPFPEYPSAHSAQSAAAATVLTALLGPVAFEDSTNLALGHPVRQYRSFQEAADEAAESRLYGGIHFPMANENGKALGRCIGRSVVERLRTRAAPPG
ncbi:MAG: vanadium-dependent haloperoxidase [Gemmatimonadetes bacterium]|nr:vanadium-dependent haloperoxidase [Gemmatimonadota bacterium]